MNRIMALCFAFISSVAFGRDSIPSEDISSVFSQARNEAKKQHAFGSYSREGIALAWLTLFSECSGYTPKSSVERFRSLEQTIKKLGHYDTFTYGSTTTSSYNPNSVFGPAYGPTFSIETDETAHTAPAISILSLATVSEGHSQAQALDDHLKVDKEVQDRKVLPNYYLPVPTVAILSLAGINYNWTASSVVDRFLAVRADANGKGFLKYSYRGPTEALLAYLSIATGRNEQDVLALFNEIESESNQRRIMHGYSYVGPSLATLTLASGLSGYTPHLTIDRYIDIENTLKKAGLISAYSGQAQIESILTLASLAPHSLCKP